jgi:hypothetical protein
METQARVCEIAKDRVKNQITKARSLISKLNRRAIVQSEWGVIRTVMLLPVLAENTGR